MGRDEILKLIENGSIRIEPFRKEQVGPASIDLHLEDSFRVFEKTRDVFRFVRMRITSSSLGR